MSSKRDLTIFATDLIGVPAATSGIMGVNVVEWQMIKISSGRTCGTVGTMHSARLKLDVSIHLP